MTEEEKLDDYCSYANKVAEQDAEIARLKLERDSWQRAGIAALARAEKAESILRGLAMVSVPILPTDPESEKVVDEMFAEHAARTPSPDPETAE